MGFPLGLITLVNCDPEVFKRSHLFDILVFHLQLCSEWIFREYIIGLVNCKHYNEQFTFNKKKKKKNA